MRKHKIIKVKDVFNTLHGCVLFIIFLPALLVIGLGMLFEKIGEIVVYKK
jgi:hypothetical protein